MLFGFQFVVLENLSILGLALSGVEGLLMYPGTFSWFSKCLSNHYFVQHLILRTVFSGNLTMVMMLFVQEPSSSNSG